MKFDAVSLSGAGISALFSSSYALFQLLVISFDTKMLSSHDGATYMCFGVSSFGLIRK